MSLVLLPVRGLALPARAAVACGRATLMNVDELLAHDFVTSVQGLLASNPFYRDKPDERRSHVGAFERSMHGLMGKPVLLWRGVPDFEFPLTPEMQTSLLSEAEVSLAHLRIALWLSRLWSPAGRPPRCSIGVASGDSGGHMEIILASPDGATLHSAMALSNVHVRPASLAVLQEALSRLRSASASSDQRLRAYRLVSDALEAENPEQFLVWITTALETLLFFADEATDVGYRMRISVMCITGRRTDFRLIKRLYRFRNKYVHGKSIAHQDALSLQADILPTLRDVLEWSLGVTHSQATMNDCLDRLAR